MHATLREFTQKTLTEAFGNRPQSENVYSVSNHLTKSCISDTI